LILIVGFWFVGKTGKIVTVFLQKAGIDQGIISFLTSVLKFVLRVITVMVAMDLFGINMTSIMTALGVSLVTIGLALKDSLSNVAGGILLVINKPFVVGDEIQIENMKGTVLKIGMVFTTLVTDDKRTIILPNTKLISTGIVRVGMYDLQEIKFLYTLEKVDSEKSLKKFIDKAILLEDKISQIPSPSVLVHCSPEKIYSIEVVFWCEKRCSEVVSKKLGKIMEDMFSQRNLKILKKAMNSLPNV
jgi:small conductance mechanosensitive channel